MYVREQTEALKALYWSSKESVKLHPADSLLVEEDHDETQQQEQDNARDTKHFIVKRGLQVIGVATYLERTGRLMDVAVRPSVGKVSETLFTAAREHTTRMGRSGSLLVMPRTDESKKLFEGMGFQEVENADQ
jgi:N-acetylglutamate synthase-like GNAT family acetyltransferase